MHNMARTGETNITIRLPRATRQRLTLAAEKRGLKLGPYLRLLGMETAEREEAAARLLRELEALEPDVEGADELDAIRRSDRRSRRRQ